LAFVIFLFLIYDCLQNPAPNGSIEHLEEKLETFSHNGFAVITSSLDLEEAMSFLVTNVYSSLTNLFKL
jgi:hypothetical protein